MTKAWHNRIVGHGEEAPDQLLANPANWRIHPKHQQDALAGVLREVGIVQDIIVNSRTGYVVDGHLRVSLAMREGQATIPVKYVDLSESEEALILATFDPLSALAGTDRVKLEELLREVSSGESAVQQMLAEMAEKAGITLPQDSDWSDSFGGVPDGERAPFQQMTFTLSDTQAELVKRTLQQAKGVGSFVDTDNENSNGNALARICEAYLG